MTKQEVLTIFTHAGRFLTPDEVRVRLRPLPDRRSVYSYLRRLYRQGLLEAARSTLGGRLVYRITGRGHARLEYFRRLSR